MIASERRIVSEGEMLETRHSLTKKLALSGRPVKIYVIDPKQFQARLEKYTQSKKTDVKSSDKKTQKSEEPQPPPLQKYVSTNRTCDAKNNYSAYREVDDQYKIMRPILIAPKEPANITSSGGTTIYFPPATTILPLQTMIPVSLSLPIMSVGTVGGTTVGNVISVPTGILASSLIKETPNNANIKKKVIKKRPVKRKLTGEVSKRTSISEEKAEAAEIAFLMKESTTRKGRVSKSSMASAVAASAVSTISTNLLSSPGTSGGETTKAPKKREPSEKFRCQTCQKFYLGNAKFNQHFAKFPDHVKPDPNIKTKKKRNNNTNPPSAKPSSERQETTAHNIESITNNGEMSQSANLQTLSSPKHGSGLPFTTTAMDEEDSFGIGSLSPIIRRSTASIVNPDTLSDNCTSPKNLPVFNMASNATMFPQRQNNIEQSNDSRLPHQQQQREYFMEFQNDFNNSSNIALSHQNGSPESFNSLENLLSDNNSHNMGPCLQSPTPSVEPLTSRCNDTRGASNIPTSSGRIGNTDPSTFFSRTSTSLNTSSDLGHHLHNSSVNVSSYISVNSCRNPVPSVSISPFRPEGVDDESREATRTPEEKDGLGIQTHSPTNNGQPKRRSIWDFVKKQIRLCGINQTCGEISEMADKLSKIARDKFYPIQEEEMERLGTASPVIQVDTPFISHLLDLPFGTYVFKEDGGIRKIILPPTPVSTELSLTNGVEVDVAKFLSPDIDLISLPHLTNLDFNSICN